MTQKRSCHPALTAWFHEYVNEIAGKPLDEPLTFGDLNTHGIQLRMISTCLTHRRPCGLPFDSAQFYFKRSDLAEYFPEPVIQWMEKHQRPPEKGTTEVDETGFCRLPQANDMPVLVAAHMSLSFPFFFRAVPLYAVDFSLARPEPSGAPHRDNWRTPEPCWFLDGGICSNSRFVCLMHRCPDGLHSESTCRGFAKTVPRALSGCRHATRKGSVNSFIVFPIKTALAQFSNTPRQ